MRSLAILALLLPAAAVAEPGSRQLVEVWQPIGKTVKLYRPAERPACAPAHVHHQAGKTQPVILAANRAGCAPAAAPRD